MRGHGSAAAAASLACKYNSKPCLKCGWLLPECTLLHRKNKIRRAQVWPSNHKLTDDLCYAVQLLDRSRHAAVISALSAGSHSSLLSQLMHSACAEIVRSSDAPLSANSLTSQHRTNPAPKKHSVEFMDALLTLIGALVASASGCSALSDAGVVPALLPLIGDTHPAHVRLVSATVSPCTWFSSRLSCMICWASGDCCMNFDVDWCILMPSAAAALLMASFDRFTGFSSLRGAC